MQVVDYTVRTTYFDIHDGVTIAVRYREHMTTFSCIPIFIIKALLLLPRCMECRHGLAMRILSVCLSV